MTEPGLLSNTWRDMLALIGVVGFVLTAIGVWLAWAQMRRTATAAKAATDAAIATFDESRARYNKLIVNQSARLLADCQVRIQNSDWTALIIRTDDLIQCLVQLSEQDTTWSVLLVELQEMEKLFNRIRLTRLTYSDKTRNRWDTLYQELRAKIFQQVDPFARTTQHEQE